MPEIISVNLPLLWPVSTEISRANPASKTQTVFPSPLSRVVVSGPGRLGIIIPRIPLLEPSLSAASCGGENRKAALGTRIASVTSSMTISEDAVMPGRNSKALLSMLKMAL
ncbi:MAG: hypothetical protein COA47_16535 [Robiginitomaculum sp.]|nr:MAG: hypothetical protein COA47_16535 [Robiginitomaculum sp.]